MMIDAMVCYHAMISDTYLPVMYLSESSGDISTYVTGVVPPLVIHENKVPMPGKTRSAKVGMPRNFIASSDRSSAQPGPPPVMAMITTLLTFPCVCASFLVGT